MTDPSAAPLPPPTRLRSLALPGLLATVVYTPLVGPLASLALAAWLHLGGRVARPATAWAGWVGLWTPGTVGLAVALSGGAGPTGSTAWLLLPLCAPDSTAAVLVPAAAAGAVLLLGLCVSVTSRRPWLWVVAAWTAPWVHQGVSSLVGQRLTC